VLFHRLAHQNLRSSAIRLVITPPLAARLTDAVGWSCGELTFVVNGTSAAPLNRTQLPRAARAATCQLRLNARRRRHGDRPGECVRFASGTSSGGGEDRSHSRLGAKPGSKVCCGHQSLRERECPRAAAAGAIASKSMCPPLAAQRGRGRARPAGVLAAAGRKHVGAQANDGRGEEL
jgi:hypothetical protein